MADQKSIHGVSRKNDLAVYGIFALSGASALIYQVIWARWLALVFGNTTLSVSIVLGSFMAGLALGSWLAGRLLHRAKSPMRSYACVELAIGAFAVCSPLVMKVADILFTTLVSSESSTAYSVLVRTLLSASVLLVPTTLMGTTLPLLTDFFHRNAFSSRSWRVGILYGSNTLGAAIGILLASFVLIELIGVVDTTLAAAALNFLVSILGFRISRSANLSPYAPIARDEAKLFGPNLLAVFAITCGGALALASEVLWTRTLETLVGNSTYAFATIVVLYLLGIAVGSWVASFFVNRLKWSIFWVGAVLFGMGLWTVISIRIFQSVAVSLENQPLYILVSLSTIFWRYFRAIVILFPLSLLSGACFPLVTRIIDPGEGNAKGSIVARAYTWNTVGALVGSLVAGFVIAPLWDYFNSLFVLAVLYFLVSTCTFAVTGVFRFSLHGVRRPAIFLGAISAVFAILSFILTTNTSFFVERNQIKRPGYKIEFHRPGLQGVTTVLKHRSNPNRDMLLVNGMGMTVKVTDTKMMAHFPMLLHPNPENTLVICLGMGTTFRSAISYGKDVTVVELVKEVVDALDYFHEDAAACKAYAGGKIVVNDGRNFLKLTRNKFDVITIDPPPPIDAAGVNNLYSREFIELARDHLNKGGIMAHWMPFPGTGSGVDDTETLEILVRTFSRVFPCVYLHRSFNGIGIHVLGSMDPIAISSEVIKTRLALKTVADDINEWDQPPLTWLSTEWSVSTPEFTARPGITTDDEPYLEFYLLRTLMKGGQKQCPMSLW